MFFTLIHNLNNIFDRYCFSVKLKRREFLSEILFSWVWREKINFFKKNKIATVVLKWKILTQTTKWIYKEEKCQKQFTNEQYHLATAIKAYKEEQRKIRILLLIKITKIMIKILLLQVLLMIYNINIQFKSQPPNSPDLN